MKKFDFFKNRFIFFGISVVLILAIVVVGFVNGVKLDIQFSGGAIYTYSYTGDINTAEAQRIAKEVIDKEITVSTSSSADGKKSIRFDIATTDGIASETESTLTASLAKAFPDNTLERSDIRTVDPFIGKEFLQRGALAIFLAALLIVLYVWYRFRKIDSLSLGVFGLVALFHDSIMVLGTFIVFGIPLNDAFIAVVLTVLGYSINDTVVIYDRVRENSRIMKASTPVEEIVNVSINQSLTRSIFTMASTFVAIACVYIFAVIYDIPSIMNFSLPLLIGVVTGCYSTIFIAGPLWAMWERHKRIKKEKDRANNAPKKAKAKA
ncbi:MAG: protein translocase subunit SecF [Clostridia bacterium]